MTGFLKISDLKTGYSKRRPLTTAAFSFVAKPGQIIGVAGCNGAGKTTVLKTLCNIIKPIEGKITFNEKDISIMQPIERARCISFVMANSSAIPDIPVTDVVAMGRFSGTGWVRSLNKFDKDLCFRAYEKTGITKLLAKTFHSISDGEKQRVLFAMAMAQNTPVMLCDEPAAFLDIPSKNHVYRLMHDLSRKEGKTVIFSTHDIRSAIEICDIIWVFGNEKIESGIPESLGLNNSFNELFSGSEMKFDPEKMDFVSVFYENPKPVDLSGKGDRYLWTQALLKRLGYMPGCNISAPVSVIIHENEDKWTVKTGNEIYSTTSLDEFEIKMKSLI